jgi:hypothetical protein
MLDREDKTSMQLEQPTQRREQWINGWYIKAVLQTAASKRRSPSDKS